MMSDSRPPLTLRSIDQWDRAIAAAGSAQERLVLTARKAGALARLSRFDESRELVTELRSQNLGFDPRLSAWIIFCEGLDSHFSSLATGSALDRFRRAYAIAVASGDRELSAISAAWAANEEFVAGRAASAIEQVRAAFAWADVDNAEARARANLVVADLLSWAGQGERAKKWYTAARACAIEGGDLAMQSVVLFNSAAFHVANLVIADCMGTCAPSHLREIELEVNSVANLDRGIGIDSLTTMVPLLLADIRACEGRWSDALRLFQIHIDHLAEQGQSRLVSRFLAQLAWCKLNSSDVQGAIDDMRSALAHAQDGCDLDDLFVLYERAARLQRALGDEKGAIDHHFAASRCIASFAAQQGVISEMLQPLLDRLPEQKTRP
jgi:hypothetical protein